MRAGLLLRQSAAAPAASGFALFGGGANTSATPISTVEKYALGSDTVSAGTSLSNASMAAAASSNGAVGIFAGGWESFASTTAVLASVDKYTFSSDGVAAGSSLGAARRHAAASCDGAVTLIAGGNASGTNTANATVYKYTHSSDSVTTGTALGENKCQHGAAGTTVFAVFAAGTTSAAVYNTSPTTRKYTYATDVVAAGTTLFGTVRISAGASGNDTLGIFAGGQSSASAIIDTSVKYTWATDAVSAGGTLTTAPCRPIMAGNQSTAVIAKYSTTTASSGGVTDSNKYTYAADTFAASTSLSVAASRAAACSSTPGHL